MNTETVGLNSEAGTGTDFKPFEHTIICPRCNRPLELFLLPAHLEQTVNCPRCSRSLTSLIRATIRKRLLVKT